MAPSSQLSPLDEQPLTSARYIPSGESFGPGVGIPPLNPGVGHLYTQNRVSQESFSSHRQLIRPNSARGGSFRNQQSTSHKRGQSQSREENDLYSTDIPPSGFPEQGRDVSRTAQTLQPIAAGLNLRAQQGSPELTTPVSPNDAGAHWPLDRVVNWLDENSFSAEWQETFRKLNIQGTQFLDICRGHGGKGNYHTMYNVVYPQLQKEYEQKGVTYEITREQEEGRRLRRLMRKTVENGGPSSSKSGPKRRDSIPWFAGTEHQTQETQSVQTAEGQLRTNLTIDGDSASPGNSATDNMPSPRPPSSLAQRQPAMTRGTVSSSHSVEEGAHEVSTHDLTSLSAHKASQDTISKLPNVLEIRDAPNRPDSARQAFDSPQLSPGLVQARPFTSNGTVPQSSAAQTRYYGGHKRNPSSESNVSLSVSARADSY